MAKQFIDHFIKNLQPEEVKSITRYIKNNTANGEESKTMEVFEAMLSGKEIRYKSQAALNKIKSRIFEKSLDGLIVDEQYISNTYCEFDLELIVVKKQLVQLRMLQLNLTESKVEVVQHLMNQILAKAKKYEMYPVIVEALIFKKGVMGLRTGKNEYEKTQKEIEFYDFCYKCLLDAVNDYYRLMLDNLVQFLSEKEKIIYITQSIKNLSLNYKKTKSQQVNYYLYIMRFGLCERKKDYKGALKWCKELIKLIKTNPCIYRPERMGFAYENLSLYNVYLGNFQSAEKNISDAKSYFNPNSANSITRTEQEFHIYLYNEKYTHAAKCIETILKDLPSTIGDFRRDKYLYFNACLLFSQQHYKEALALIIKPLEIEKDKERWNISIRILTILIYIELNKLADASRTLEALRKYMERNKINGKIKPRDQLIIKTLRELEKDDFVYTATNTAIVKLHKQLSADNTDVSWEYYSAELVKFHEWLGRLVVGY